MNLFNAWIKKHREALRNGAVVFVMVLGTFVLLTMLGIVHFGAPDFQQIAKTVEASADPATMVVGDETALRKNYGIAARDVAEFVYYAPKSAMDASEILILRAREEAMLQAWRAVIDARRRTRTDMYANYRPEEALLLENAELKVQGSYLIFISATNVQEVKAAIDQSFR